LAIGIVEVYGKWGSHEQEGNHKQTDEQA
jgi:hypothetical protein